jgi:hypothetical protein
VRPKQGYARGIGTDDSLLETDLERTDLESQSEQETGSDFLHLACPQRRN